MVDLQQVFIEKTKSNLQHKSSTTGFNCMVDHVRQENRHLHQEKIPPLKSLHKLYHQQNKTGKNKGRTRRPAKKLPRKKTIGGSSPVQDNRGHDTTNPNNIIHSERKIPQNDHACVFFV